jgi:DNA polymerase-3 subunit delta
MTPTPLSELKPVYLLYGPEDLHIERQIESFRDRLAQVADLDYNYRVFEAPQHEMGEIVGAANTLPFMSDRQMVVVRDVDQLNADARGELEAYVENPAPHTTMVLVARRMAKNMRLYKRVADVGAVHEFAAPKASQYPSEVTRMFERRGKKVDLDAAEVLVELVGRDLRALQSEVDKLVAHAGTKKRLVRDDIMEVVSETSPTSVFEFLDAVGARDAEVALRLLARLVDEGERVHGVHAMAVRHARDLITARAIIDRGEDVGAIQSALGKPPWLARKLASQASRFTEGELVGALGDAAEWEARMKTSRVDPRLAVERWVVSVCEGA